MLSMPPSVAGQGQDSQGNFQAVSEVPRGTDNNIQDLLTNFVATAFGGSASLSQTVAIVCTATNPPNQAWPSYSISYYAAAPVLNTSLYCIGSVTKVFTASLLLARQINGELAYNPIATANALLGAPPTDTQFWYLTGDKELTIYDVLLTQLATHSACIDDDTIPANVMNQGLYDGGGNPCKEQIDAWKNNDCYFPQSECQLGQNYNYSNWGYLTLGFAASRPSYPRAPSVFDYDKALQNYVLGIFGLNSGPTSTFTHPRPPLVFVDGYNNNFASPQKLSGRAHGLHSNLLDMGNFLLAYMIGVNQHQRSTQQTTLSNLASKAITPPLPAPPNQAYAWGLGKLGKTVPIVAKNGVTTVQGFGAWIAFTPGQAGSLLPGSDQYSQLGVVVLVNRATPNVAGSKPENLGTNILMYLLGRPLSLGPALDINDPEISDD
jgi:CubicO group peptidase (beta-lactamase class C family)